MEGENLAAYSNNVYGRANIFIAVNSWTKDSVLLDNDQKQKKIAKTFSL